MSRLNVRTLLHRAKIAAAHETNEQAEFNLRGHLKAVQQTFFFKYISDTDVHTEAQTHTCMRISPP